MSERKYPGVQTQRHKRPDGSPRVYHYHRATKTRLVGEPGSAEFEAAYAAALKPKVRQFKRTKPRFVYFFQCETLRHIKIGSSCSPHERFVHTQSHCPDRVVVLGIIPDTTRSTLERELQQRFKAHRIHGEWFREHDELLNLIQEQATPVAPMPSLGGGT